MNNYNEDIEFKFFLKILDKVHDLKVLAPSYFSNGLVSCLFSKLLEEKLLGTPDTFSGIKLHEFKSIPLYKVINYLDVFIILDKRDKLVSRLEYEYIQSHCCGNLLSYDEWMIKKIIE